MLLHNACKSIIKRQKTSDLYHISIDGKDIISSGKCPKGRDNIKE